MKLTVKKYAILIASMCILGSCTKLGGYVKRSANEQTFDTKGFQGKKRTPAYNAKYVQRAQRNMSEENFDDRYDDLENLYYEPNELKPYHKSNRRMYQDMMDMNESKQNLGRYSSRHRNYPRINDVEMSSSDKSEENLKNEIKEIKKMLADTKEKMATYKCPVSQNDNFNSHALKKPKRKKDIITSVTGSGVADLSCRPEDMDNGQCED
jgi:hypothetical protein